VHFIINSYHFNQWRIFILISEYAKVGYAKLNLLTRNGYAIKQWYKNMGEDEDTPLVEVVGIYNKMHPQDRVRVLAFFEKAEEVFKITYPVNGTDTFRIVYIDKYKTIVIALLIVYLTYFRSIWLWITARNYCEISFPIFLSGWRFLIRMGY